MKKILPVFILLLFLSGCSVNADYIEPEDRVIVSAIGIQNSQNNILLTLETVDISTNSNEDAYSTKILTGVGKTVYQAVADAENKAYGEVLFSQCPVILIDTGITAQQLNGIWDYCLESENISLAVRLLVTYDPYSVLNDNNTKKALGYEIMNLLEYGDEVSGVTKYDTFVTIVNLRNNDSFVYRIPFLTNTDGINIGGAAVFQNDRLTFIADLPEAQLLQTMCGSLKNCTLICEDSVIDVKKTYTTADIDGTTVNINIKITAENFNGLTDEKSVSEELHSKLNSLIKSHTDEILQLLKQNHRKISNSKIAEITTEISITEEI